MRLKSFLLKACVRTVIRRRDFGNDPHPGRPKILFIGLAESSHTVSWINLLAGTDFNVRLYALSTPGGIPPQNWTVRTYVTTGSQSLSSTAFTKKLYPEWKLTQLAVEVLNILFPGIRSSIEEEWLRRIILTWRPDIIHTLGLDFAGAFYYGVRQAFGLESVGKWVLQLRGGSDLTLNRFNPSLTPQIAAVLNACDQIVSDNEKNFEYALEMGVSQDRVATLGTVPGTGGVDVESISRSWVGKPSTRRLILWPKAYECPWSKALPVFEALKACWSRIQPCEIRMLHAMDSDTRMWYWALPPEIRQHSQIHDRVPQEEVLTLMRRARVMLAPSLVDGTPNTMFEAMASGAFPIVSPLVTIRPLVTDGNNVLFARNLYPEEIAAALIRAMTDDELVDAAAERNLNLVRQIADRALIAPRVIKFYEELVPITAEECPLAGTTTAS